MEYLKSACHSLLRKRFRSALTIIGISIGVISVIVIGSIGHIGKQVISSQINGIGVDGISISRDINSSAPLEITDVADIESINGVAQAMPLVFEYTSIKLKNTDFTSVIWGIGNSAEKLISVFPIYGRLFNKSEISAGARVCIVDESYGKTTYKRTNIVGKTITVLLGNRFVDFKIVGVVKSGNGVLENMLGDLIPNFVYLPYTTMQSLTNKTSVSQIAVRSDSMTDLDSLSDTIVKRLESTHQTNGYMVSDFIKQKEQFNNILDIITLILTLIAGISLLVSGLSVMTIMLVSVGERTREIGIKKSIGATKSRILLEFLIESVVLCTLATGVGLTLGPVGILIGCLIFKIPFLIDLPLIIICLSVVVMTGVIFGVYPAFKASRLSPVEALRFDS